MKQENFSLALLLAKKASLYGSATVSTSELASITGFSQQSISRKLRELESEQLISRTPSSAGTEISFTEKGRNELKSYYLELGELFSKKKISLKGKLFDGHGEGAYYTSLPQYEKSFSDLLGGKIFHGTLNLIVGSAERSRFTSSKPVEIAGFTSKERTFGGISAWPCLVNGKEKAIAIIPHRTNHPANILEIVAKVSLRKKFKMKNDSEVELVKG
ncbi:MAG: riboflavin kinase [Candidatus Diapherotrites archaeon CG11_big_fil_rev_8_21_14_0_20_37_9]|nr:MAG: riboflavin kinase [Candidatus Diapherotrites archaeon CG11_big_fil_rev_8_21_14_0_20_37_9]